MCKKLHETKDYNYDGQAWDKAETRTWKSPGQRQSQGKDSVKKKTKPPMELTQTETKDKERQTKDKNEGKIW